MPTSTYPLGRIPLFDERSRQHPGRTLTYPDEPTRNVWWHLPPLRYRLNQTLGSCTCAAAAQLRNTQPNHKAPEPYKAIRDVEDGYGGLYPWVTRNDPFPGCLVAGQRVLTADLSWTPIEKLSPGDAIVGFDEHASKTSRYRLAHVLATKTIIKPCYEIRTDHGTVVCSEDHLFVRRMHNHDTRRWARADSLRPGDPLIRMFDPTEPDNSYEAGWLAGLFDGEGSVDQSRVGAYQVAGTTLDRMIRLLSAKGFGFTVAEKAKTNQPCYGVRITGGFDESLRFLSLCRPERLIANMQRYWDGSSTSRRSSKPAIVQSVVPVGQQEVYATATSTQTLVVEGLLSHNSWPPEDTGSSVLTAAKGAVQFGWATSYVWYFGVNEVIAGLPYSPIEIGTDWTENMFRPNRHGYIEPTGDIVGGHAYVLYGMNITERWFGILNSWRGWGINRSQRAKLSFEHADQLLKRDGEAMALVV